MNGIDFCQFYKVSCSEKPESRDPSQTKKLHSIDMKNGNNSLNSHIKSTKYEKGIRS